MKSTWVQNGTGAKPVQLRQKLKELCPVSIISGESLASSPYPLTVIVTGAMSLNVSLVSAGIDISFFPVA